MQRYQWLLFDGDGALFDFDPVESAALKQYFQLIGTAFDPVYLTETRRINQTLWQGVEKGEIRPRFVDGRSSEVLLEAIEIGISTQCLQRELGSRPRH